MSNITPYSQLEAAIDTNDEKVVRTLLAQHPEIGRESRLLTDLLRHAATNNNVSMVSLLVECGADVNAPESADKPEGVILDASREGAADVVRWLLDHGATVNHRVGGITRCLALTGAACDGHLDVVKLLVERGGADVNAVWAGQNALSFALMYGQKSVEKYLRTHGALLPSQLGESPPPGGIHPILQHVEKHLGKPNPIPLREIVPGDPSITIHVVPMADRVALVTTGMSDRPMLVPEGAEDYRFAELVIYLPRDWPLNDTALRDLNHFWPIEWLRRIAHYPHENHSWLGGPAVVFANGEPPQPLAPNTRMTCLLALTEESEFGWLPLSGGKRVAFYSLYPLYTEERDFEIEKGTAQLLSLFQKHKISEIVDINRPNVALLSGPRRRRSGRG